MPLKLYYSRSFGRDIVRLTRYISDARDPQTATAVTIRLKARCEALLFAPRMGAPYSRLPGIRKINEGPYKIFYRVTEDQVIILRLWDGRRGTEPKLPGY
jgi:plasmid stabilization system protein ParE